MIEPTCDHPNTQYLAPADAIAEFLKRGMDQMLVDLIQDPRGPEDDVDVHVCPECDELLFLFFDPDSPDPDIRSVYVLTDRGKGTETPGSN